MAGFRDIGPPGFNFEGWVAGREREYAYTLESYVVDHEVSAQVIVDTHDEVLYSLLRTDHTTEQLSEQLLNINGHVTGELADTHARVGEFLERTYADIAGLVSYNDRKLLEAAAGELQVSGPGSSQVGAIFNEASSPQDARLLSFAHDYSLWGLLRETAEREGVDHPDVDAALRAASGPEAARAMRAGLDHIAWRSHPGEFAYRPEGAESPIMTPKPASGDDVRAAMAAGSDHAVLQTALNQAERLPEGTPVDIPESMLALATPLARLLIELQDLSGSKPEVAEHDTPAPLSELDLERLRSLGAAAGHRYLGIIGLTLQALQAARQAHLNHLDYVAKTSGSVRPLPAPEEESQTQPAPVAGGVKLRLYAPSTLTVGVTTHTRSETGSNRGKIIEMTDHDDR
jgi:hypothetical protein